MPGNRTFLEVASMVISWRIEGGGVCPVVIHVHATTVSLLRERNSTS